MALLNLNFPCEEFIWKWKKAAPTIYEVFGDGEPTLEMGTRGMREKKK